jgi:hypothetical protein
MNNDRNYRSSVAISLGLGRDSTAIRYSNDSAEYEVGCSRCTLVQCQGRERRSCFLELQMTTIEQAKAVEQRLRERVGDGWADGTCASADAIRALAGEKT